MKIISVQSKWGGRGVTLTAAELALEAMHDGKTVVAIDTCPMRDLKRDIEDAGFDFLDDVRQLFRPLAEARWVLTDMPCHGLFCYTESDQAYLTRNAQGKRDMIYRKRATEEPNAANRLEVAMAYLALHYDVMIVDVENKNKRLMQLFWDVSDEVHFLLRDNMLTQDPVAELRAFVDRTGEEAHRPKIVTHKDRMHVPGDLDPWGNSIALKPFIAAAQGRGLRSTAAGISPQLGSA